MRLASLDKLFQLATSQVADPSIREQLLLIMEGKDSIVLPEILLDDDKIEELDEEGANNLIQLIRNMSVPQKIKLAITGNQVARGFLIRDSNWLVSGFVLENPRLTETEIYDFAKNTNLDEQVHRAIASRPDWMKDYAIKLAITANPKTPIDISIKWIKHLQLKDLRNLARSRGVPQVLATQCKKLYEMRQKDGG